MYISGNHYSTILDEFCRLEPFIECLGIVSTRKNKKQKTHTFVCTGFRVEINHFLHDLSYTLALANKRRYFVIYVCGDFNMNLLKSEDNLVSEFINLMFTFFSVSNNNKTYQGNRNYSHFN